MPTDKVRAHMESAALWIYNKYHPLQRLLFKYDNTYFAEMLLDFAENAHRRASTTPTLWSRCIRDSISGEVLIHCIYSGLT